MHTIATLHIPHLCVWACVCVCVGVKQSITISYQGKYIIVDRALSEVIASRKLLAKFLNNYTQGYSYIIIANIILG